jgi:hypothetical protein
MHLDGRIESVAGGIEDRLEPIAGVLGNRTMVTRHRVAQDPVEDHCQVIGCVVAQRGALSS